ncbi:MAG: VWA domain-containing protein [Polyangiaceae bacterium]
MTPNPQSPAAIADRNAREKSYARVWRGVFVVLGVITFIAIGGLYPALARGEAWRSARWESWWWMLGVIVVPFVVWRMTLGSDSRVPRLGLSTIAPIANGPRGWRTSFRDVPGMIRGAALVLGLLALARPQDVLRGEQSDEVGIDIMIVLDLSGSMRAIMDQPADISPPKPSAARQRLTRLETAKEVILDFISRRKTDRIGVIVFGRNPYVLSPLTLDYDLLATLVQKMELDLIDGNGTAIGDAVGTAVAHLRRSTARSKTIILLTDGDSNAGNVDAQYAAHLAQVQGVKVFTVQLVNGD